MLEVSKIRGIEEYECDEKEGRKYYRVSEGKVFLVLDAKTLELRTDARLGRVLAEKYESVMRSRYFGQGGIEIVQSGQIKNSELEDLIRLSYNLTVGLTRG